jgi:CHAT domain-containing protein
LAALPPLPGIDKELSALARVLRARGSTLTQRVDQQATEQSFRSETLSRYGLLYFATHAVLPGTTRCLNEPALALSAISGGGSRADDGLLEASEVSTLRLEADLVVLSACNTATRARALSGESLTGLAQAFFSAGARRVLATHWPVDSRWTAELMESVFSFQRENDYSDIADSLRDAQIRMLRAPETRHPWFWAGFTVLGTGPARAEK